MAEGRSERVSWSKRQERGLGSGGHRAPYLDRYELVDELGQGGMSVVYRARDKQLGRDVAVKLLHDFLARQEDSRKRFHREAVAVARLRHPGIVEIYDYSGPEVEDAYIVCELIEGATLRQFVDEHGAPAHPEFAVLVVLELVRALRHAHEQGIVHRDVKPENVMITRRGQLKLMDFGIAQIMEGATKLTATGTLLGSPAHMAPEVIDGKPSDHRSDIFSVGTLLYWLATGQLPFAAPNPSALFRLILEGTYEPPQLLQPRIGNGLARIIERALEPDPEARYQDVSELQDDLQKELDEVGLEPADSLVKQYLGDPSGFVASRGPQILSALVACGQAALDEGNTGRAMDRFNRVLAVDPEHPEVSRLVSQIGRKAAFQKRAKRGAVFLSAAAVVGLLAYNEARLWPDDPAPEPPAETNVAARPAIEPEPPARAEAPAKAEAVEAAPAEAPAPRVAERRAPALRAMAKRRIAPRAAPKLTPRPRKIAPAVLAGARRPSPEAPPAPAKLHVKIGPGWGHIRINGLLKKQYAMKEAFELKPGRYTVEVSRDDGHHRPRTLEVDAGQLWLLGAGGKKSRLPQNELRFRMPAKGETLDGWVPNSEEARAPATDRGT